MWTGNFSGEFLSQSGHPRHCPLHAGANRGSRDVWPSRSTEHPFSMEKHAVFFDSVQAPPDEWGNFLGRAGIEAESPPPTSSLQTSNLQTTSSNPYAKRGVPGDKGANPQQETSATHTPAVTRRRQFWLSLYPGEKSADGSSVNWSVPLQTAWSPRSRRRPCRRVSNSSPTVFSICCRIVKEEKQPDSKQDPPFF